MTSTENEKYRFATQGRGDGSWKKGSVWISGGLILMGTAPEDGI